MVYTISGDKTTSFWPFRAKTTSFYAFYYYFFSHSAYTKTKSFWTKRVQNNVVLNQFSLNPKRRRFGFR